MKRWQMLGQSRMKQRKKNEKRILSTENLKQTETISNELSWTWLQRGHLKRETDFLVIASQNKDLKINYIRWK